MLLVYKSFFEIKIDNILSLLGGTKENWINLNGCPVFEVLVWSEASFTLNLVMYLTILV